MTRWILRIAWIASLLLGLSLLDKGSRTGSDTLLVLGGLALVNANLGFAATALVGRLEILIEHSMPGPTSPHPPTR